MHTIAQPLPPRLAKLEPKDSLRLAAIDVGSNSLHMVIVQADADGAITTLWRMKEMVGLGRLTFPSKRLTRDAIDRALSTLSRFQEAARARQCEKILAIATSAVREAVNGGDFIERAKRERGLYVRVVSAREEARLIYLAARHAIPMGAKPHFIVDIGGGSVEFICGDDRHPVLLESRKLGAARMTAQFIKTDPPEKQELKSLLRHYEKELGPLCEKIAAYGPVKTLGTSGTLENLAAMTGSDPTAPAIERNKFDRLLADLLDSKSKDRAKIRGLDDQRKDQIIAGALLVDELFRRLDLKRIEICPAAMREGICLDYLNRHMPDLDIRREVPDPRRRSVIDLARRCHWHQTHSEQVAHICLALFNELKPLHKLDDTARELIEYGALLHDIGWHIGRQSHHKHSMYLILHGDLKGFTPDEIKIIASIARYHRKATPSPDHDNYATLSANQKRIVDVGAALLRLSDGLDRSHSSVVQTVRCKIGKKKVKCTLGARSDAELEVWGARRKREWFEKVFGRTITFEVREAKK
jgi:exopolyphosphatase / guanosine-5'-triphosphate,3'-diphosphate pyrophosphatase